MTEVDSPISKNINVVITALDEIVPIMELYRSMVATLINESLTAIQFLVLIHTWENTSFLQKNSTHRTNSITVKNRKLQCVISLLFIFHASSTLIISFSSSFLSSSCSSSSQVLLDIFQDKGNFKIQSLAATRLICHRFVTAARFLTH